jgi:hypothetical protein
MTAIQTNVPMKAPDGSFDFTYMVTVGGHEVAEIEGRAEVDDNGDLDIWLFVIGTSYGIMCRPDADLLGRIEPYLRANYQDEIAEAHAYQSEASAYWQRGQAAAWGREEDRIRRNEERRGGAW